jgi:high-affinity iron transporter
MHQNSKAFSDDLRSKVESVVGRTRSYGLASLAFISIFREGVETVLFLGSASFSSTGVQILVGGALGLLLAVALGFAIMRYSVRLDLKKFFGVTGVLLILFAAGLIAHGILEFEEAGYFNPLVEDVYDVGWLVGGDSELGRLLSALFGYDPSPSLAQILGYIGYWAIIAFWAYQDATLHMIGRAVSAIRPG